MRSKRLSSYAAVLIITLFGAGATMLIVDASYASIEAYEKPPFNPFALDADFESGRDAPRPEGME